MLKNLWEHRKKIPMGQGGGGECSSFFVILAGFYSVKHEEKYASCFPYQNLHSVCPHAKCRSGLQCQRSPSNIYTTTELEEWHV